MNKNVVEIFNNEEFGQVRTLVIDEKPYVLANDVARALGYSSPKDAVSRHCKGAIKHRYLTNGGEQEAKFIPEGDIYRLIMKSKLPSAEKFESWVMDEVLPTIRKHGAYMTNEVIERTLTDPDYLIRLATALKEERQARLVAEQKIEEQKPLVDFANQVSDTTSLIDMNQMAKLLKDENIPIGRNRLFEILRKKEILRNNNEPYQKYIESGYFKVKENTYDTPYGAKTYIKTYVTGKGQIWITEKLRKEFGEVA